MRWLRSSLVLIKYEETFKVANALIGVSITLKDIKGNEKKRSKNGAGHQPLNPVIIQALIGMFVCIIV